MPVQSVAISQSGRFIATGQALSPHKGMHQVLAALNSIGVRCASFPVPL
jgi:hypothetical protein